MKTEAQIYRDAIKVLQRDGWRRDPHWATRSGPTCIGLAVQAAANYEQIDYPALTAVIDCDPVTFNDYHCETIDDAIAALEIAADLAS